MRSITIIKSHLNRAKAQLEQLDNESIFSDSDRELLKPRYEQQIADLTNKLSKYVY